MNNDRGVEYRDRRRVAARGLQKLQWLDGNTIGAGRRHAVISLLTRHGTTRREEEFRVFILPRTVKLRTFPLKTNAPRHHFLLRQMVLSIRGWTSGWQIKLRDPLISRAIRKHFRDKVVSLRNAMTSVSYTDNNGLFDTAAKAGLVQRVVYSKQQTAERS